MLLTDGEATDESACFARAHDVMKNPPFPDGGLKALLVSAACLASRLTTDLLATRAFWLLPQATHYPFLCRPHFPPQMHIDSDRAIASCLRRLSCDDTGTPLSHVELLEQQLPARLDVAAGPASADWQALQHMSHASTPLVTRRHQHQEPGGTER